MGSDHGDRDFAGETSLDQESTNWEISIGKFQSGDHEWGDHEWGEYEWGEYEPDSLELRFMVSGQ